MYQPAGRKNGYYQSRCNKSRGRSVFLTELETDVRCVLNTHKGAHTMRTNIVIDDNQKLRERSE